MRTRAYDDRIFGRRPAARETQTRVRGRSHVMIVNYCGDRAEFIDYNWEHYSCGCVFQFCVFLVFRFACPGNVFPRQLVSKKVT